MRVEKRPYYLRKQEGVFYTSILDKETGTHLPWQSTGKTVEREALMVISTWLRDGVPHAPSDYDRIISLIRKGTLARDQAEGIRAELARQGFDAIRVLQDKITTKPLVEELRVFWDEDRSPFIKEWKATGHSLTPVHCKLMREYITSYWLPRFGSQDYREITRQDLKSFALHLKDRGDLAAATINKIMNCGTRFYSWMAAEGEIKENPAARFTRIKGAAQERGVLTPEEAAAVFSAPWRDTAARTFNLTEASTGLRAGEVLALQGKDIQEGVLSITKSWNQTSQFLKLPKNGKTRKVPLLSKVREALLSQLTSNPHVNIPEAERFVFWGKNPQHPRWGNANFLDDFRAVMETLGIDWKGRHIDGHSWRHFYDTFMSTEGATLDKMQLALGHLTPAMTRHYREHENLRALGEVRELAETAFNPILGA